MVYEYVPFGSVKDIVSVVDENLWPLLRFTYHVVPDGRLDSVSVIVYNFTKLTDFDTAEPSTLKEPIDIDGS